MAMAMKALAQKTEGQWTAACDGKDGQEKGVAAEVNGSSQVTYTCEQKLDMPLQDVIRADGLAKLNRLCDAELPAADTRDPSLTHSETEEEAAKAEVKKNKHDDQNDSMEAEGKDKAKDLLEEEEEEDGSEDRSEEADEVVEKENQGERAAGGQEKGRRNKKNQAKKARKRWAKW